MRFCLPKTKSYAPPGGACLFELVCEQDKQDAQDLAFIGLSIGALVNPLIAGGVLVGAMGYGAKNIYVTTLSSVIGVVNFRVSYAIRRGAATPAKTTVRAIQRGDHGGARLRQHRGGRGMIEIKAVGGQAGVTH